MRLGWISCRFSVRTHRRISRRGATPGWIFGGRELTTHLRLEPDGTVSSLTLTQRDPLGRGVLWPQHLQVAIGYADHAESISVSIQGAVSELSSVRGRKHPLYVLPNGGGLGYGMFFLDDQTRRYLAGSIEDIPDALSSRKRMGGSMGQRAGGPADRPRVSGSYRASASEGEGRAEHAIDLVIPVARVLALASAAGTDNTGARTGGYAARGYCAGTNGQSKISLV